MDEETQSANYELILALSELTKAINNADGNAMFQVLNSPKYITELSGPVQSAFIHILNMYGNSGLFDYSPAATDVDFANSNSYLPFPIGFKSPDNSAVLGKDGYVFLIGGSNNLLQQYSPECADDVNIGPRWVEIIENRYERLKLLGVKYLQMLIPEKISIIPNYMDREIQTPTRLLNAIEYGIKNSECASSLISATEIFNSLERPQDCCSRLDSHLSPRGSFELFRHIAKMHFEFEVDDFQFRFGRKKLGDMSHRMTGYFCPETSYEVAQEDLPEYTKSATLINEIIPESGLKGTTQVWKNEAAPIDAKIIVFGNSYFSLERNGQSALSWWFARYFKEFHFIWTNEVEFDYVEANTPDYVLWQGVERFAPLLPAQ